MTMNLQQQSDECGYALEAFAKVLKNNNIEAVGKPHIELIMEYQKEYRKLKLNFYHITFNKNLKSYITFLLNVLSFKFLKVEKPGNYLMTSIKNFFVS